MLSHDTLRKKWPLQLNVIGGAFYCESATLWPVHNEGRAHDVNIALACSDVRIEVLCPQQSFIIVCLWHGPMSRITSPIMQFHGLTTSTGQINH